MRPRFASGEFKAENLARNMPLRKPLFLLRVWGRGGGGVHLKSATRGWLTHYGARRRVGAALVYIARIAREYAGQGQPLRGLAQRLQGLAAAGIAP